MFSRKVYGQSKITACPFCDKHATTKNRQNIPVCRAHINESLEDIKCTCGRMLEIKESKYGPFFVCSSCGAISFKKGMEIRDITSNPNVKVQVRNSYEPKTPVKVSNKPKEIQITTNDPEWFD